MRRIVEKFWSHYADKPWKRTQAQLKEWIDKERPSKSGPPSDNKKRIPEPPGWENLLPYASSNACGLNPHKRAVHMHLKRRFNFKTRKAWPSIESMAKILRMKPHTVLEYIDELEKDGLITVIRRHSRCNRNEYIVHDLPREAELRSGRSNAHSGRGIAHRGNTQRARVVQN